MEQSSSPLPDSLVADTGVYTGDCGYCRRDGSSTSHGMIAKSMTAEVYQDLIDLGWRRSGTYLYKPDLKKTCCPQYTIRLWANEFQPSKGQAKLLKKWDSCVEAGGLPDQPKSEQQPQQHPRQQQPQQQHGPSKKQHKQQQQANRLPSTLSGLLQAAIHALVQQGVLPQASNYPPVVVLPASPQLQQKVQQRQQQQEAQLQQRLPQKQQQQQQQQLNAQQTNAGPGQPTYSTAPTPSTCDNSNDFNGLSGQRSPVLSFHSPSVFAVAAAAARATGAGPVRCRQRQQNQAGAGSQDISGRSCPMDVDGPQGPPSAAAPATSPGAVTLTASAPSLSQCTPTSSESNGTQGGTSASAGLHAALPAADPGWLAGRIVAQVSAAAAATQTGNSEGPDVACAQTGAGVHRDGEDPVAIVLLEGGLEMQLKAEGRGHLNWYALKGALGAPAVGSGGAGRKSPSAGKASGSGGGKSSGGPNQTKQHQQVQQQQQQQQDERATGKGGGVQISMAPNCFDEEEFQLYLKYQVEQHGDDPKKITRGSYRRFLVDSPLPPPQTTQGPPSAAAETAAGSSGNNSSYVPGTLVPHFCGYGSFHMQYRIDGKLMAVGVVDILPRCLSSVYLFWDCEFAHLAPGKLSALKEIEWVQQASRSVPELQYYYMGFYIHSCPKMRYKADYHPSDLNCPESKAWVRITPEVLHALDASKYVVLSQLPGARCARNSAPVGVASEREAPCFELEQGRQSQGGSSSATSQAHASTPPQQELQEQEGGGPAQQQLQQKEGGADEEAFRRQHVLQEVARRKARQQAIAAAADEVKTIVFDMVYPWKILKHAGVVVSKEQAGALQRLIEAWVSITGGVAQKLGYELA